MFDQTNNRSTDSSFSLTKLIVAIVIIIVLIGGFVFFRRQSTSYAESSGSSGYQAVFLSSGQVYFGKIQYYDRDGDLILTNIYYLQSQQNPQNNTNNAPSLVKLGNEVHGPTDQMTINSRQVLFIEDMKSNSKVVQAINNYQKGK